MEHANLFRESGPDKSKRMVGKPEVLRLLLARGAAVDVGLGRIVALY
jgi:hypothetical protein